MAASSPATQFAVVPQEHRWVEVLHGAFVAGRFPVRRMVLDAGELQVTVALSGLEPLTIVVRPQGAEERGFRTTARFAVTYHGARLLGPRQEQAIDYFCQVFSRIERRVPPKLRGFASVGEVEESPERTITGLFPFVTVERSRTAVTRSAADVGAAAEAPPGEAGARPDHALLEVLVRTTSTCNQRCPFCSAPEHDTVSTEGLVACLQLVSELLPGAMVSLTGGEPTLRKGFVDEVKAALALPGLDEVQVQTNAVRFARRLDPAVLPATGKLTFFVSLHALDHEVYDRCTGTRGQLPEALEGVRRILAAGHQVTINTLAVSANLDHLETMVAELPGTFAGLPTPALHFSTLICPEYNPAAAEHLVRYAELVPVLEKIARRAEAQGMDVESLLSSTHASMPACLAPQRHRGAGRHILEIAPGETGHEDFDRPWVKAQRCTTCREDAHCLGVPVAYARRFGLDELRPLTARRRRGRSPGEARRRRGRSSR